MMNFIAGAFQETKAETGILDLNPSDEAGVIAQTTERRVEDFNALFGRHQQTVPRNKDA